LVKAKEINEGIIENIDFVIYSNVLLLNPKSISKEITKFHLNSLDKTILK
jgi:hypothetical protein